MKPISTIILIIFFTLYFVKAQMVVTGSLSGSSLSDLHGTAKHRHSLDCYVFGKGDESKNWGSHEAHLAGETKQLTSSGVISWQTRISNPFPVKLRETQLLTNLYKTNEESRLKIQILDHLPRSLGILHKDKCGHVDGYAFTRDATISGSLTITYKVPDNIWALQVQHQNASGVLGSEFFKEFNNVLNPNFERVSESEYLVWVKPGQEFQQHFEFENFIGSNNLGQIEIIIKPLGLVFNTEKSNALLEAVLTQKSIPPLTIELLNLVLSFATHEDAIFSSLKKYNFSELKKISDGFFNLANDFYPEKYLGLAAKVAYAIAAFKVAQAFLLETSQFCKDIEMSLPFTGDKQKVIGIRALNFWFNRSINFINTYSYQALKEFLHRLDSLQKSGLTPAQIAKNQELKISLQKSFELLLNTMSFQNGPYQQAFSDFSKIKTAFTNSNAIFSNEKGNLFDLLEEAIKIENELAFQILQLSQNLSPTQSRLIDLTELFKQIEKLENFQQNAIEIIKISVKLLSIDNKDSDSSLVSYVYEILNHQINIFEKQLDIPYFDSIRTLFFDGEIKEIIQSNSQCFR